MGVAIGLGTLLKIKSQSGSQSYPLQGGTGIENRKRTIRKTHTLPLSAQNDSAWVSDDNKLPTSHPENPDSKHCRSIAFAHEVDVRSDIT